MKILSLIILLSLCWCANTYAQKLPARSGISGVVLDSLNGRPLRMASVSLLAEHDSAYITATITDGEGHFQIRNVNAGNYRILVTFLGYRNASRFVEVHSGKQADAGTMLMTAGANTLNEIIVKQERPPITVKPDTLEFNAGSFKTQPNAQAEDLIRKLPGMEVARDGSIKANGQSVSKVLVDGKPFFGNDPKMATRNLPADIIDKVQLYDQSSDQSQFSGIDDGNRERTINLTIKRDKGKGYFGQNSVGAGPDTDAGTVRYQGRLNVNRFKNNNNGPSRQLSLIGQINNINQQNFTLGNGQNTGEPVVVGGPQAATGSGNNQAPTNIIETKAAGVNYRAERSRIKWGRRAELAVSYFWNQAITTTDQQSRRNNILPDRSFVTDQSNYSKNRQATHRFNGRFDWQLDSLTSLRISPNVSWLSTDFKSHNVSHSYSTTDTLNDGNTSYGSDGKGFSGYNNLLLMRKFNKEGRTFSLNLNTIFNDGKTNALNQSANVFYDSAAINAVTESMLDQRNRQLSYSLQNTFGLSYTEPLSLSKKLELRYTYAKNSNRANRAVTDLNEANGQYDKVNEGLSNRFSSIFATHKIGTTLQVRRLRYTYALGLDFQQAELGTNNRSAELKYTKHYPNLLPNALLSYTFARNQSLRLQYRTRLNPPSVSQLQPVIDNTNSLNLKVGNPSLKPEFYNNVTLTFNGSGRTRARTLFVFGSLNQSNRRISTATDIDRDGAQTTRPVNTGGYWSANGFLSVGRTIQPIKLAINFTINGNVTHGTSLINDRINKSENVMVGQGIRLQSSYNGKFDYGLNGNISYQTVNYSLLEKQNTAFWSQYATADLHWEMPLNFVLSTDLTYTATTGRSKGYNKKFTLWNVALSRKFLKGKQGEVRIQIFDLLNQNRSLVRNTAESYVEDVQSKVLKRYFLVSFVYNLRKFGI